MEKAVLFLFNSYKTVPETVLAAIFQINFIILEVQIDIMKEFKMYADIVYQDSFRAFVEGEDIGSTDFILTNEFLYNEFVKPLDPKCGCLFIEAYGQGEPTTEMVDEIRKEIPADVKRLIAIGAARSWILPRCFPCTFPPTRPRIYSSVRKLRPVFTTSTLSPQPVALFRGHKCLRCRTRQSAHQTRPEQ